MAIQDSQVSGNSATSTKGNGGGGIYSYENAGTMLIQGNTISGNTAEYQVGQTTTGTRGGGVLIWKNFGTVTVDSDTISGNTGGSGGGISVRNSNAGTTIIENSTISGNTGTDGAGVLVRSASGTVILQNSTISGNNASDKGGGVYTIDYQSITIQNSTITGNTAQVQGGGLFVKAPTAQYYTYGVVDTRSTIISGNTDASGTAPDVGPTTYLYAGTVYTIATFANSLVGNNTGSDLTAAPVGTPDANGNLVGTSTAPIDAKLGPLAANGGPTRTCALLAGSPAIDMGSNPANLTTDQRGAGFLRQAGTQTDIGAYESQLGVTGISPAQGPVTGGTQVTITGAGFTGATAVNFGGTAATSFTVVSDSQITATSPAGTGKVDITVTTPSGTSPTVSADQFGYTAVVTGISPALGPATGGTPITINGVGFTGATAVNFGSTAVTSFTVVSDAQITVTTPAGAGKVDVTVTTPSGTSATVSADQFSYTPVLTGISPASGPAIGGTTVTLTGVGFTGATTVKFGGTVATSFTVVSDSQVTATSPAGTGKVDITVTTPGGTSATVSADQFSYTPVVATVSPVAGTPSGGTHVTITGAGFTGATAVNFGSTAAAALTVDSDTQITVTSPAGTGLVDVTVTTPTGTSAKSSADQFSYAPVVTGISPAGGPVAGGTLVTITGVNLTGATAVNFGSTTLTSLTIVSDTKITVTSPAGTGTVDVTVVTAGGTSVTSSADQFSYGAVVTAIGPTQGPPAGGRQVMITGLGFTGATAVDFGSTPASSFTVVSDTQIKAVSPAGTGVVDVTVTTPSGTSAKSSADQFTYAGVVSAVTPSQGPATGGTQVTIWGANFTGVTAVNFGTTAATSFTLVSDTEVTATSPGGTGVVDVTVTTPGGISATSSSDHFSYTPVVAAIGPAFGKPAGGTQITIEGLGLTGVTAVNFGSTAATSFTVVSDTQITATAPAGTGVVDVTVVSPTGTSATSSLDQFSYAAVVTTISPTQGVPAGGTLVTITGGNFTGATAVNFGSTAATSFTVVSDTQITAMSPAGAGLVDVTVVAPGGTSAKSTADQFGYTPAVTTISPTLGAPTGGTQVTITGAGFTGATAVSFGSTAATSFTVVSDTKITATSPAGAGKVDVTVTTPGGTSAKLSADQFSYTPVLTGITPALGPATGSTQVTITGAGFTGATTVNFGSTAAASFTVVSDTKITATSPAGTGKVDITVTTPGGTSAKLSADQFSYTPVVTRISPAQGPLKGGTQVTITGVGLTGATAVKFGGNVATIQSNTDTQIVVITPAGTSSTVDVTVTTANGTSAISSGDQFTYLAVPVVTGLSPASEPVAGGMKATITGTGLAGATAVKFGNTVATIQSDTTTQIVVTVPAGTVGTVDVTVVTGGGTSAIVPIDQFTYYTSGTCAIGLYDPTASVFYLRNCNTPGYTNNAFVYGTNNGFIPLVGDWDGNGTETVGLYDPTHSVFYLSNSNSSQVADITFAYGPANSGDIPIVGDWDANGTDTVGLYDPRTSTFYLRNSNTSGLANTTFVYGAANGGLTPLVGDWYGGGKDTVALYNPTTSMFYLRNSNTSGFADVTFTYGPANSHWTPVVGDWNGDGKDSIGLYNPTASVFYLRNSNEGGYANMTFVYGAPNTGWKPIVGVWMGDAKALMAADQVVASPNPPTLTQAQIEPIVSEAIAQWGSAGVSAADIQKLEQVQFVVSDLPGAHLGEAEGNVVYLDANAAGNGWFVDQTPAQNEEFSALPGSRQLQAVDPRALDRIDLLTVVEHELGHVLGLNDLSALADDVMDGVLGVGVRRTPSHVDAALAS